MFFYGSFRRSVDFFFFFFCLSPGSAVKVSFTTIFSTLPLLPFAILFFLLPNCGRDHGPMGCSFPYYQLALALFALYCSV